MGYFNYEKEQKEYKQIDTKKETIMKYKGKLIVYLRKCDYAHHRGYIFPKYAIIHDIKYSQIFIDNGNDSIDKHAILEIAVKNNKD